VYQRSRTFPNPFPGAAMPSRFFNRDAEQQLPFTGDSVHDSDFAEDSSHAEHGSQTLPLSRSIRSHSITAQSMSGSISRNPVRSFAHQTSHSFAGGTQPIPYTSTG
jgi:SulP family sulfate permease